MPLIGIDFGGTKVEIAAINLEGNEIYRHRVATPQTYESAVRAVCALIQKCEEAVGSFEQFGIGIPGSPHKETGLVRHSNRVFLNGKPFSTDLCDATRKSVFINNDANCFALSEATDGAAKGEKVVFGVVLGTGCGGGIVVDGKIVNGRNGLAGEWGHTPLPSSISAKTDKVCWCGREGCLELFVSGTGLEQQFLEISGLHQPANVVFDLAESQNQQAQRTVKRFTDQLSAALASAMTLLDTDVVVIGGGLSNQAALIDRLNNILEPQFRRSGASPIIRRAKWGDSSGYRGAARLPIDGNAQFVSRFAA